WSSDVCSSDLWKEDVVRQWIGLTDHLDGVDRALPVAGGATGALVVVEGIAVPDTELDDRVLRAGAEAPVALEAVATGQAPGGLELSLPCGEPGRDLVEGLHPRGRVQGLLLPPRVVAEVPEVQLAQPGLRVLGARLIGDTTQPGVDVASGLLAVSDADRDGPLARDRVAAGEDPGCPGHQRRRVDLDDVPVELDSRHARKEPGVTLLTEREYDGVGLERLELSGRLRPAVLIELLDLDGQVTLSHLGDRAQPVDPDALVLGLGRLLIMSRHLLAGASVDDDGVVSAEAARDPGGVHRGVATAVDGDPAERVGGLTGLDTAQEAHGVQHPARVLVGDVHPFRQVRPHG